LNYYASSDIFSGLVSLLLFFLKGLGVFGFLAHLILLLALLLPEPLVVAISDFDEVIVGSLLDNLTELKDDDFVTISDGRESMGNDEGG
jgi:hypothetical protein